MSLADKKMCIPVSSGRELADPNSMPKQTSLVRFELDSSGGSWKLDPAAPFTST